MTTKIKLIVSILIFSSHFISAQTNNVTVDSLATQSEILLKGLKKATPEDLDPNVQIVINPMQTPVYTDDFKLIKTEDFLQIMSSGEYIPEPYINENKIIKVFVLRKATDTEKIQVKAHKTIFKSQKNKMVGQEAPAFSLKDIYGKELSLRELTDKIIVINFWFIECRSCILQMSELNNLVDKYKDKDVVFLGFSVSDKTEINYFLNTHIFKYNIVADCKNLLMTYNVNTFPTNIVIDKNAKITYFESGGSADTSIRNLDKAIEYLIK